MTNKENQQNQSQQNPSRQTPSQKNNPSKKQYMPDGTEEPVREADLEQDGPNDPEKKIQIDDNPDETEKKIPHMKK